MSSNVIIIIDRALAVVKITPQVNGNTQFVGSGIYVTSMLFLLRSQ